MVRLTVRVSFSLILELVLRFLFLFLFYQVVVNALRPYIRVSLKHDGTDGTVKMASLPVPSVSDRQDRWLRRRQDLGPSACPVSQEARQIQTLLLRLSDPAEDFLQAVHCPLHRSPCVILYTKQQIKNGCVLYFECVI